MILETSLAPKLLLATKIQPLEVKNFFFGGQIGQCPKKKSKIRKIHDDIHEKNEKNEKKKNQKTFFFLK